MPKVLALGDCNTLGARELKHQSYPERFAKFIKADIKNCGYTMSTTREMQYFAKDNIKDADIVLIQYGLVDSWKTFKYSPYVLYYPDNIFRKYYRKIVKKYKKICKAIGLNKLLGVENVVPDKEYKNNIELLIKSYPKKLFILIDTIPNLALWRNDEIVRYNKIIEDIAKNNSNVLYLKIYDVFLNNFDTYYLDKTHINNDGYEFISLKLAELHKNYKDMKKI
jgi:lysophospholipase L1-like esterase